MNTAQNTLYTFALIAPYGNLAALCRKLAADLPCALRIWANVYMEAAVPVAREAALAAPDGILSRGATAAYIRDTVDVPVISVSTTALDLLRTIKPFVGKVGRVAFFHYKDPMLGVQMIADTLNVAIDEYIFHDTDDVQSHMLTARAKGTDLVVGGIVAVQRAKQHGLDGLLLEAGEEAVWHALREAMAIAEVRRKEQQRQARLSTILNTIAEGILVTDEQDTLTLMNPTAERLLGLKPGEALGRPVTDVVPNTRTQRVLASGQAELGAIQDVGGATLVTSRVPIIVDGIPVGVVCTFSDAGQVQQAEQRLRGRLRPKGFQARYTLGDIVTHNDAMCRIINLATLYAGTDATVVLQGESGTGKELFAQGMHCAGKRAGGPFVAVNCAAIPEQLLESELFGYEEGAFTGAKRQGKAGLFELAHQGTLFLDELGELPQLLQARLLRVLQEREIVRVGGSQVIPVDIRIICATNSDLAAQARRGAFRKDLFYRLNVLRLKIPPLRERGDDVLHLGYTFLRERCPSPPSQASFVHELGPRLRAHDWPGNVRELAGVVERLALVASMSADLSWAELLHEVWEPEADSPEDAAPQCRDGLCIPLDGTLKEMTRQLERQAIRRLLALHGDRDTVAALLDISRVSLWRKALDEGEEVPVQSGKRKMQEKRGKTS